ncbi:hypothetical protein EVG20_g6893 [Dentipellis fragilis]|uniref:Uncharacterized protein n=1 Tax=Dentipellis fragilis TaxID=205917 RepID=A0A4Y9YH41_9AGAM|nr:hypothetical protein EVG20_g6893 [Dentipellis fragilis]
MSISAVRLVGEASARTCRSGRVPRDPGIRAIASRVTSFADEPVGPWTRLPLRSPTFYAYISLFLVASYLNFGFTLDSRITLSSYRLRQHPIQWFGPTASPKTKTRTSTNTSRDPFSFEETGSAARVAQIDYRTPEGCRGFYATTRLSGLMSQRQGHDMVVGHVISLAEIEHQSSLRARLGMSVEGLSRMAVGQVTSCAGGGWTMELTEGEAQDVSATCLKGERTRASPGRGPVANGRWPCYLAHASGGWTLELIEGEAQDIGAARLKGGYVRAKFKFRISDGRPLATSPRAQTGGEAQDGGATPLKGGCARKALVEDLALTAVGHITSRTGGVWTLRLAEGETQNTSAARLKGKCARAGLTSRTYRDWLSAMSYRTCRRRTNIEPARGKARCTSVPRSECEFGRARLLRRGSIWGPTSLRMLQEEHRATLDIKKACRAIHMHPEDKFLGGRAPRPVLARSLVPFGIASAACLQKKIADATMGIWHAIGVGPSSKRVNDIVLFCLLLRQLSDD